MILAEEAQPRKLRDGQFFRIVFSDIFQDKLQFGSALIFGLWTHFGCLTVWKKHKKRAEKKRF